MARGKTTWKDVWKELAEKKAREAEEMEAERKRFVVAPAPDKPKIVVSDEEVERTLSKAKLSFKVVKP